MDSLGRCCSSRLGVLPQLLVSLLLLLPFGAVAAHGGHRHHGHRHSRRELHQENAGIQNVLFGTDAVARLSALTSGLRMAASQSERVKQMIEVLQRDDEVGLDTVANELVAVCESLAVDAPPESASQQSPVIQWDSMPNRHLLVSVGASDPDPSINDTFKLHSRPSAVKKIFLDFRGCTVSGTAWKSGATIVNPPYDIDGNPASFSNEELSRIVQIWRGVAEDFAPFEVDVTTEQPPGTPGTYGSWACIGGDGAWYGSSAGGVAYVNVFGGPGVDTNPYYQPAWVFTKNLGNGYAKYTWEATSHEVGHNFGLSHDGTPSLGYYKGHGYNGQGWAPIMGVGYYQQMSQWSKGEYVNATNFEDDVGKIAAKTPLIADHGASASAATDISTSISSGAKVAGVVSHSTSSDWLKFTASATGSATVTLYLAPHDASSSQRTDLDAELRVLSSSQAQLGLADPPGNAASRIQFSVTVGVVQGSLYYITVRGVGNTDVETGPYSNYGSLGSYAVGVELTPSQCAASGANCTSGIACCGGLLCVAGTCGGQCPAGTYQTGTTCTNCSKASNGVAPNSPQGSTTQLACFCNSTMFYRQNSGCYTCGSTTTGTSTGGKTCTCAPGYVPDSWTASSNVCTLQCLALNAACPNSLGASCCNNAACINGKCGGTCPANTYLEGVNTCTNCTIGSNGVVPTSPTNSTSQSACSCRNGLYYRHNAGCFACGAGTTGNSTDGKTCTCAAGFDNFNNATNNCAETCRQKNATCSEGGLACCGGQQCIAGVCGGVCPAGTYLTGTKTCTNCTTAANGVVPTSPLNSTSQLACFCNSTMFYRQNSGCFPCGSTTSGSPDGKTCTCAPGYVPNTWTASSNACTLQCLALNEACPNTLGASCCNNVACINGKCGGTCPANTYLEGVNNCTSCTTGSNGVVPTSLEGSTSQAACSCPSGLYYRHNAGCFTCGAGTTGNSTDGKTCTCDAGFSTFDNTTGTCNEVCRLKEATCSAEGLPCCNGERCVDGVCGKVCPAGSYLSSNNTCNACAGGAQSPANSTGQSACYCSSGDYYRHNAGCFNCGAGTTGNSTDGKTCTCAAGFSTFDNATGTCNEVCRLKEATCSAEGLACCPGSQCINGICTEPCPTGTYRTGASTCTSCTKAGNGVAPLTPVGSHSQDACYCPEGLNRLYYRHNAGCVPCDTGTTYASGDGKTCSCYSGYTSFDNTTGTCSKAACPKGTFMSDGACKPCAGGGTTDSEGATSELQCRCPAVANQARMAYLPRTGCMPCGSGTTGVSPDGQRCACASGYYRDATSATTCTACKVLGTYKPVTEGDAVDESACLCTTVVSRLRLYYKLGAGCTRCGTTTTTSSSSDGKTCPCNTGYGGFDRRAGTCAVCPFSTFWNATSSSCASCIATSGPVYTSTTKTTSELGCKCSNTYQFYQNRVGCTACPAGSRAAVDGHSCVCPTGTWFSTATSTPSCQPTKGRGSGCASNAECTSKKCAATKKCT